MHKSGGMKANIAFFGGILLYTLIPPVHIKYVSAIEKHNSGWRKNRGATLGGNLAN